MTACVVRVLTCRVVKHLYVVEHVLPFGVAREICLPPYPFPFQELREALSDSIVMAITTPAHAGVQVVFAKEGLPLCAGELRTLDGMDHHLLFWCAPPNSS